MFEKFERLTQHESAHFAQVRASPAMISAVDGLDVLLGFNRIDEVEGQIISRTLTY